MTIGKNHGTPTPYNTSGILPTDLPGLVRSISDELGRIDRAIKRINLLIPQSADREPEVKLIGMQRYAKAADWDPLSTGVNTWVYWDGTNWVTL